MAVNKTPAEGNAGANSNPVRKAKGKDKPKSTLFNLSKFGKQYFDEDGQCYGFRLAGYRQTDDKNEYCNIWIKGEDVSVKELPGGDGYAVRIRLLEVNTNLEEDEE